MDDGSGDIEVGKSRFDRDWTEGPILRNLISLSWPMVITNTFMMLGPTIDMIWVGKLGSASVAGVGVSGMAVQLVGGAMMGLAAWLVTACAGGGTPPASPGGASSRW